MYNICTNKPTKNCTITLTVILIFYWFCYFHRSPLRFYAQRVTSCNIRCSTDAERSNTKKTKSQELSHNSLCMVSQHFKIISHSVVLWLAYINIQQCPLYNTQKSVTANTLCPWKNYNPRQCKIKMSNLNASQPNYVCLIMNISATELPHFIRKY